MQVRVCLKGRKVGRVALSLFLQLLPLHSYKYKMHAPPFLGPVLAILVHSEHLFIEPDFFLFSCFSCFG